MSTLSLYDLHDGVAVVTLDHPPVNALAHPMRVAIIAALDAAERDNAVGAVVITGAGSFFCTGADVHELGSQEQSAYPLLPEVMRRIEGFSKPVIAAIQGAALGGGLELALCCSARVACATALIGLTEINLGLIPGAGGTQRLPRLIGPSAALALMLSGQPSKAASLAENGLFDRVIAHGNNPIQAACDLARKFAQSSLMPARAGNRALPETSVWNAVAAAGEALTPRQRAQPAYRALLDAVSACTKPFDEGLACERSMFLALVNSPESQALRYLFEAEREATRLPHALHGSPRTVSHVAVIGAGTMGTGIAICALDAGLEVTLLEQDAAALQRGKARVHAHYADRVVTGRMKAGAAASSEARLTASLDWPSLVKADLVIEAVYEDISVKQEVFNRIDAYARADAILATNTSYLDIDAIAGATNRPQNVLGLHFFSPANVMKLLEVVRGAETSLDVLSTGMAFGRRLDKVPVCCGNSFGFVGNRIYNAYRRQCEYMLEDGAWPEEVDAALTVLGFAMGPFAVADMSGLDIAWRMRKAQATRRDPAERYVSILDELCEAGRLGRKTGAGYYAYVNGKQARESDSQVRAVIQEASARRGVQRQPLTPQVIQRRALLAMVDEAAHLIAEGVAARASDIDVVLAHGYGFPRCLGGPVLWARAQDRVTLAQELSALGEQDGRRRPVADLAALFS